MDKTEIIAELTELNKLYKMASLPDKKEIGKRIDALHELLQHQRTERVKMDAKAELAKREMLVHKPPNIKHR
ncbi:MAG: hypothetical protein NUV57_00460 [archaeon]|nr:hypothetical protein [archaeon]